MGSHVGSVMAVPHEFRDCGVLCGVAVHEIAAAVQSNMQRCDREAVSIGQGAVMSFASLDRSAEQLESPGSALAGRPGMTAEALGYLSKPTNTVASLTDLRSDTTALAGKVSSGQPSAMLFMMTWSSAMPACSRTTGDCMMPWLLITAPSPRDQAALTSALVTAPQSNGVSSLPSSTRS